MSPIVNRVNFHIFFCLTSMLQVFAVRESSKDHKTFRKTPFLYESICWESFLFFSVENPLFSFAVTKLYTRVKKELHISISNLQNKLYNNMHIILHWETCFFIKRWSIPFCFAQFRTVPTKRLKFLNSLREGFFFSF